MFFFFFMSRIITLPAHDIDVAPFITAADVVFLIRPPTADDLKQGVGMILHVEPVTHVLALAINRQRFAMQRIQDRQQDQLLGKMERPIVFEQFDITTGRP